MTFIVSLTCASRSCTRGHARCSGTSVNMLGTFPVHLAWPVKQEPA
jgi:hypothetical protein